MKTAPYKSDLPKILFDALEEQGFNSHSRIVPSAFAPPLKIGWTLNEQKAYLDGLSEFAAKIRREKF